MEGWDDDGDDALFAAALSSWETRAQGGCQPPACPAAAQCAPQAAAAPAQAQPLRAANGGGGTAAAGASLRSLFTAGASSGRCAAPLPPQQHCHHEQRQQQMQQQQQQQQQHSTARQAQEQQAALPAPRPDWQQQPQRLEQRLQQHHPHAPALQQAQQQPQAPPSVPRQEQHTQHTQPPPLQEQAWGQQLQQLRPGAPQPRLLAPPPQQDRQQEMEDSAAGQDQPQQQLPPAGGSGAEEQAAAGGSGAEEEQAPAGGGGAGEEPAPAEAALAAAAAAAEPAPKKRRLKQLFDYLLVLDIESTCDRDKSKQPSPQEIIELSCVVVDTAALQVGAGFQRYVRPDQHPQLTDFCTELTGITQGQVDAGVPLRAALADLDGWLRQQGLLGKGKTFAPATWRDWDLKVMLAGETRWRGITQPKYLSRWVDLSAVWFKHSKQRGNLAASVAAAGLTWEGRAHSALDDARNTARLAIKILQGGVILGLTGSFGNLDASGRFRQGTLLGMARGGKADGGGGASGGGGGGGGRGGGGATAAGLRKKQITDAAGAWTGICFCGAKAKKRTVKRPGPNNGRDFWSCSKFTMTGGAGCDLFKFADEVRAPADLLKESAKSGRWGR